ncbi:hypothetical protein ACFY00_34945 [Kitasatospora sp. NPDC001540]|uniref:hypothetical protein n=1 Tax=Kitasatospora sp. NPDC001540 TaxID=3364014 RepID=UPI00369BCD45
MSEQELSDVFARAVGSSAPDLGLLVAGATAEGRSIRLRRRLAFAGAVAAVAALAVGGGLLLRPAAAPPAVSAAAPGTGPGAGPGAGATAGGGGGGVAGGGAATASPSVPARPAVLDRLLPFVPRGLVLSGWEGTDTAWDGPTASVLARFHRGPGEDAGTIEVRMQRVDESAPDRDRNDDCRENPAVQSCAPLRDEGADGVVLALSDDRGRTVYRAELTDQRGFRFVLSATGPAGGTPPLDRTVMGKVAVDLHQRLSADRDGQAAQELAKKQAAAAATSPPSSPDPSLTTVPGSGAPAAAGGARP